MRLVADGINVLRAEVRITPAFKLGIAINLHPVGMFSGAAQASDAHVVPRRKASYWPVVGTVYAGSAEANLSIATIAEKFFDEMKY